MQTCFSMPCNNMQNIMKIMLCHENQNQACMHFFSTAMWSRKGFFQSHYFKIGRSFFQSHPLAFTQNWEKLFPKPPCRLQNWEELFPKLPILAAELLPQCQSFWLCQAVLFQGLMDLINDFLIVVRPFAGHFHYGAASLPLLWSPASKPWELASQP